MKQKCRKCDLEKDLSDFPKNGDYKNGKATICKLCSALQVAKYRKENYIKYRAKKFKISEEEMAQLMTIEFCQICGDKDNRKRLSVDHNHYTGKIRGMLCNDCNAALGFLKEDLFIIPRMIKYLEKHNG